MRIITVSAIILSVTALVGAAGTLAQAPAAAHPPGHADARAHSGETLVTVTGFATLRRAPDRVTIMLGASATAKTALSAHDQLNTIMDRVVRNIKDLKLEKAVIQTQGLSLTPAYERHRAGEIEPRIIGYTASSTVNVQIDDPARAGAVIDAAMAGGANVVQGIIFSLADDDAAQRELLAGASKDGRARAEAMAGALGLRITRVVEVQSGAPVMPLVRRFGGEHFGLAAARDAAPTVVEAGEASASAQVTVVFAAAPAADPR